MDKELRAIRIDVEISTPAEDPDYLNRDGHNVIVPVSFIEDLDKKLNFLKGWKPGGNVILTILGSRFVLKQDNNEHS